MLACSSLFCFDDVVSKSFCTVVLFFLMVISFSDDSSPRNVCLLNLCLRSNAAEATPAYDPHPFYYHSGTL